MNRWTKEQISAIEARGGSILVSAAAGSGKTATLVERIIKWITGPVNPIDIDRLLIVTFTKAAAADMRERVSQRLAILLAEDPFNKHLQRQQLLLPQAHISTIHSFCSELVRENFYQLGVSPDFRISEEGEKKILRQDVLEEILERKYEEANSDFLAFIDNFSNDRDDSRVLELVYQIYDFIKAQPFPVQWLEKKENLYRDCKSFDQSIWAQYIRSYAKELLAYCLQKIKKAFVWMQEEKKIQEKLYLVFLSDQTQIQQILETVETGTWQEIHTSIQSYQADILRAPSGYINHPIKILLAESRNDIKAKLSALKMFFSDPLKALNQDLRITERLIGQLFKLTMEFAEALEVAKKKKQVADYDDLEHWSLKLLLKQDEKGLMKKTSLARQLSSRFNEIMVDEYQDTNKAQDMIIQAISQEENNLFMVGDVKQSIYTFRQAMPKIFLERRASFQDYNMEKEIFPARIMLNNNFRSRKEVSYAVNFVFRQLMTAKAGDVDYADKEELVVGSMYEEINGYKTQVDILDLAGENNEMIPIRESQHIAETIQQMMENKFKISDHGRMRPIRYKDFCILLRQTNRYAPDYAKELHKWGIPSWADVGGSLFETTEIAVILSFLRCVDNPMQDIPLAAVLMSPIYGMSAEKMTDIKMDDRKNSLYSYLLLYAQEDLEIQKFLRDLEEYRTVAVTLTTDQFLVYLYEKTGYINMIQSMKHGNMRLKNLHMLLEYAKKYESSGYHGLSDFIQLIDRLQTQKTDFPGASLFSENADVVRIMSIHKSKGLEFPVCIVAGCSRDYKTDRDTVALHVDLGLGIKIKDSQTACRYSTLTREAILMTNKKESMSEELRILYVAMTRAREKLIFVNSLQNPTKELVRLGRFLQEDKILTAYQVSSVNRMSDWILSCALRHPSGYKIRELAGLSANIVIPNENNENLWDINIIENFPEKEFIKKDKEKKSLVDIGIQKKIEKELNFLYPYQDLCHIPNKITASELAAMEFEEDFITLSRLAFISRKIYTAAERGTALHEFMQFSNYKQASQDLNSEIKRLVKEKFISEEQAKILQIYKIQTFFRSALFSRMISSKNLQRELRFTVELPVSQINKNIYSKENIILQGAIDCVFEENGKLVLVDYKTDYVQAEEEFWKRYQKQLDLYRLAVEQCLRKEVKEMCLYSFSLEKEITQKRKIT